VKRSIPSFRRGPKRVAVAASGCIVASLLFVLFPPVRELSPEAESRLQETSIRHIVTQNRSQRRRFWNDWEIESYLIGILRQGNAGKVTLPDEGYEDPPAGLLERVGGLAKHVGSAEVMERVQLPGIVGHTVFDAEGREAVALFASGVRRISANIACCRAGYECGGVASCILDFYYVRAPFGWHLVRTKERFVS